MNRVISLREFSFADDYDRVLELWRGIEAGMNVGRSDSPEEIKKKLERDPDLFLVAESQNQIIGTVIGAYDGRRGMIYHLAVRRDFRRQGVGAKLLAEVENRLRAKGCVKSYLHVLADNKEAMRFYEECGWTEAKHDVVFVKEFS